MTTASVIGKADVELEPLGLDDNACGVRPLGRTWHLPVAQPIGVDFRLEYGPFSCEHERSDIL